MKRLNIFVILLSISLFTASFDLFLDIHIGGFTVRLTQAAMIAFMGLTLMGSLLRGKATLPLGFKPLLLWTLFLILFIPNTTYILRNILYTFWLFFSILGIYTVVQFINSVDRLRLALRIYVASFVFVASFGLIQWAVGFLGISLLTMQWYFPGRMARINGFCYEPSFFVFYLIQGFILVAYLREKRSTLFSKKAFSLCHYAILTAIILSTARSGWLICALWYSRPGLFFLGHLFKGQFHLLYFKKSLIRVLPPLLGIILIAFILVYYFSITVFISGLGLFGLGGSHSSLTRWNDFLDLVTVFEQSPLIGYGLGGVNAAVGKLHGVLVETYEEAKSFEGVGVFAQILAASGLIGFIPFALYVYQLIQKPLKLLKSLDDPELKKIVMGMTVALVFALIVLQSGQNILRPYLWYHIALLSASYAVARRTQKIQGCVQNLLY